MQILESSGDYPKARHVARIVETLKEGKIVAYPTDTTYGIGCALNNIKGIKQLMDIRKDKKNYLFSFICNDFKCIGKYTHCSNTAYKLIRHYLPGPYTFILNASSNVPKVAQTKRKTVGVRIPALSLCQQVVALLDMPIITTTAKHPEKGILTNALDIKSHFKNQIDLVVDSGNLFTLQSTVIDLTGDHPVLIREGEGDISELLSFFH